MTFQGFNELQERIQEKITAITLSKGKEYAKGADRLENFKTPALKLGITPEQVLYVFLDKHIRSIEYYCAHGEVSSEAIEGRILDAIVYLQILWGLVEDRTINKAEKPWPTYGLDGGSYYPPQI